MILQVGDKLTTKDTKNNRPLLEVVEVTDKYYLLKWLNFFAEPFKISRDSISNTNWIKV